MHGAGRGANLAAQAGARCSIEDLYADANLAGPNNVQKRCRAIEVEALVDVSLFAPVWGTAWATAL